MYINNSDQTQTVIGVGQVVAGGKFVSDEPLNNPNFELLGDYEEGGEAPTKLFGVEAKPTPPEDEAPKSKKGVTK